MPLASGARLGCYEILSPLGVGGMGEVYRAHDTKLNRDVAIKVLLPAVANDPERLARFSREAQLLASLNHPHIAHIHGLEESSGVRALVMELVDGPTLADRIAQGPIPLAEALVIAKQVADARGGRERHDRDTGVCILPGAVVGGAPVTRGAADGARCGREVHRAEAFSGWPAETMRRCNRNTASRPDHPYLR